MFLLPIHVDLGLSRIPFLSLLVCLICIAVYVAQTNNLQRIDQQSHTLCEETKDQVFDLLLNKIYDRHDLKGCVLFFNDLNRVSDHQVVIDAAVSKITTIAAYSVAESRQLARNRLEEKYAQFMIYVDRNLTANLAYVPQSYSPLGMITSVFAHADFWHIAGNLVIFFAFAASVEIALGHLRYLAVFFALAIVTSISYSLAMSAVESPLPTIGLSGVVMGMMGIFMYLMPWAGIRCLLWIIVVVKMVTMPAWILGLWYVGWDVYQLFFNDQQSNVNFVAHVSGATFGYLFGFLFCYKIKRQIKLELTSRH